MYRVMLVDDHPIILRGVCELLKPIDDLKICAKTSDPIEAIKLAKQELPDVALVDLTLPEMNGVELIASIRQVSPKTEILVLSMHGSLRILAEAMRLGARGYVLKSDMDCDLLTAVRKVREHEPYISPQLVREAMLEDNSRATSEISRLTRREVEILKMLAGGQANKQISKTLGISRRTVEQHRSSVMHKLRLRDMSELVRFAVRNRIIEDSAFADYLRETLARSFTR